MAGRAAQEVLDELAQEFLDLPDVGLGKMFSANGLKVRGKFFALVSRGQLVVKIPRTQADALLAKGEVDAFEPSPGRKMGEWMTLAVTTDDNWRSLISDAHNYVSSLHPPGAEGTRAIVGTGKRTTRC